MALDYIRDNPCDKRKVSLPRVERPEVKPLTDEQVQAYIKAAEDDEHGNVLKIILFTGLRECEALGLTWDCVDFESGKLTINKQLQRRPQADGGYTFTSLKNDKVRVLYPAPFVMDCLKAVKNRQAENRMKHNEYWQGWKNEKEHGTWLCFTNEIGTHITPKALYLHHKKIAARAGAPDACVHDLRHTFAVLSLQNGDDVKTVQTNLGHATASFTLDVYGHCSERMKENSANRMQQYITSLAADK